MSALPRPLRRSLCRLCYLLPAIFGIVLLIWATIPHFWYVYEHQAYESHSLFSLQGNVWEQTQNVAAEEDWGLALPVLRIWCVLFWALPILYGVTAAMAAVTSVIAFAFPPVSRAANKSKRVLHLLCPNRTCFLLFQFLPLVAALLPQVLLFCYTSLRGMEMRLATELCHDWVLALCFALCSSILFLVTLPLQREEGLDMFRIYKKQDFMQKEEPSQ